MCGITGIIDKNRAVEKNLLELMCDRLKFRGPDAQGVFIDGNVGLGHRRLSVIDLSTGDQPMFNKEKSICIVFNGEIYNFLEIRNELENLGYQFHTKSDTEVIINGYSAFGIDHLLQKIEGMFAFALYDKNLKSTFLVRDKFGEKPLYYSINGDRLVFASELKALKGITKTTEIDLQGLNLYLSLSYIPAPFTIYKNVSKLAAGSYLEIKNNLQIREVRYYDLLERINQKDELRNINSYKTELNNLLYDSVKKRMISDVPLGVFLSGGIDSSIIASIMSRISSEPINTFSIGFRQKEYDESKRAEIVAEKIKSNHTIHYLDYQDITSVINDLLLHFDEPFGDSSAIPSYYVAKLAREKVTVVLTGDCADELFMGYEKYLGQIYTRKYQRLPLFIKRLFEKAVFILPHLPFTNNFLRKIKKVINNSSLTDFELHYNLMCMGFTDKERCNILNNCCYSDIKNQLSEIYNSYHDGSTLEKGQYLDLKILLEGDMLVKVDRMCMKNSLEARVPFLDSKIVETALRMPMDYKLNGTVKKFILKESFKDILPAETINFSKKGFTAPIDHWLKNELKEELEVLIDRNFLSNQNIFRYDAVKSLYDEHKNGRENHMFKLWNFYVFQKWYKNNFSE